MKLGELKKIINSRRNFTTDSTGIQGIILDCCKELYAKIFDNLGEIDKFLPYNLPSLNHEGR